MFWRPLLAFMERSGVFIHPVWGFTPSFHSLTPQPPAQRFRWLNHKPLVLLLFFSSLSLLNFIFCQRISCPSVLCLALSSTSSSAGDDNQPPSASASQDSVWNWPVRKDQLPEMSKGLVLLHSLGIGRESGGVSFGPYWPLFSSLRPQDVFSKGLVHLPRKGRLRFPCTESRISEFLFFFFFYFCQTTQYVCTNILHCQRMHIFLLVLLVSPFYMTFDLF